MHFTILRDQLLNALNVAARAISLKNPNPILTGIKFELNNNGLFLTGSSSDLSIVTKIPLKENETVIINVQSTGVAVISSKYVLDIVRKLEGEEIEIEVVESVAFIRSNGSEFQINCLPSEDYPPLEITSGEIKFSVDAALVRRIIEQVGFAASVNENRPILTGVNFTSDGRVLTCVATDSFRLARKRVELETGREFNVTVPAKTLAEVGRVLDNERAVEITINDNRVCFKMVHTIVVSRVISNPYPNTEKIVPEYFATELAVPAASFASAIDRASLMASENNSIVQLSMDRDEVKISSRNQTVGSAVEKIKSFRYAGERLDISFSAKYGTDAIKALNAEEIILKFNESAKPFVVINEKDPTIVQLILPAITY